jgi:hypothetical protein
MKIQPRYYPLIIVAAYLFFVIIGFLLGFLPEREAGGHGRSALQFFACLSLGAWI